MLAFAGLNGNPSVLVTGFFAVTSNTVQVGGALTLHASGSGIRLDAEGRRGLHFSVAPDAAPVGSVGQVAAEFTTFVRDSRPGPAPDPVIPLPSRFPLQADHLVLLSRRGASRLFGIGRSGADRFIGPGLKSLFVHREPLFQVTSKTTLTAAPVLAAPTSQWEALLALADHVAANPGRSGQLQVSPLYEMGTP